MPSHFSHALMQWQPLKTDCAWVLGAVIHTQGAVYRKTGALMLLSDAGHQLGLLSGGCLEADLLLQARKVIALEKSRRVTYDANDEGGLAWRLGIGCGGAADILLHPCTAGNDYLQLDKVAELLHNHQACRYQLHIESARARCIPTDKVFSQRIAGTVVQRADTHYLDTLINPQPHLLILGSGIDMIPVCQLAVTLGWQVSLVDQRLTEARRVHFPAEVALFSCAANALDDALLHSVDGAIIAHHNITLDAAAVRALQRTPARYIGLLGPAKRKADVLAAAELAEAQLHQAIAGPMGLALGGDLPESIALSVLAECHAVIFGSNTQPLSSAYAGALQ